MNSALTERYRRITGEIADAATQHNRNPADITTIVVTKFHPAQVVNELYELGVRDVGENRHQEAVDKHAQCRELTDLRWHFIGQLQSNKARAVREYASVVHSVDRASLIAALGQAGESEDFSSKTGKNRLDCFVQLNLTNNPERGGVAPQDLLDLAELVLQQPTLHLLGVMAVAPLDEDPRQAFARVRAASEELQTLAPDAQFISAGMSHDFRDAIAEGATHLRIGSSITGERTLAG